jgi:hypothetical protein
MNAPNAPRFKPAKPVMIAHIPMKSEEIQTLTVTFEGRSQQMLATASHP